ncbi:hypothetical protein Ddye_013105 [Dipteronia dyeriana]|uniref:Uncharacterized protein n=1 Tax=Dipteronia dyeriana TaxID=168575 RepID=A0AAD9X5N7_9ROSI|nr:hypothetical protein Ddye_013105 [Dipteronia dyeriana]
MEAKNIDWSNIDSIFEEDYTYENINAPKWVYLSYPTEHVDDETWDVKRNGKENRVSSVENPKTECLDIQASDSSSDNNENQNPNQSIVTVNIKSDMEKKKQ